ncbi:MAG: biotin--[acetyl-CoA-carboxylase] ligase [Gemmataceae bacterium]|nr:biotin--[acetyl-CoA-carboxylase] ligase [Gemmata sp.]MDW8196616.1 biotin--[acetyl-CoA-carboxylase] ligase [Gemmataceae bacterium]
MKPSALTSVPVPRELWQFPSQYIGQRVWLYDCVESTNTLGLKLASDRDNDGLVLIAHQQTAGRGQYGRVWTSPPGCSLLMSVIVRPPVELCRPVLLTAWVAVAVAEAIQQLIGQPAQLKWPNDLLLDGQKCCGILIEQTGHAAEWSTIAGIGLNLNQSRDDFLAAQIPQATSLSLASGRWIEPRQAAEAVIHHLDAHYARLRAGEQAAVESNWKGRLGLLGRPAIVELTTGEELTGRVREITFTGVALEIDATTRRVLAPEAILHIRPVG